MINQLFWRTIQNFELNSLIQNFELTVHTKDWPVDLKGRKLEVFRWIKWIR